MIQRSNREAALSVGCRNPFGLKLAEGLPNRSAADTKAGGEFSLDQARARRTFYSRRENFAILGAKLFYIAAKKLTHLTVVSK